jgi:hypothetical protein
MMSILRKDHKVLMCIIIILIDFIVVPSAYTASFTAVKDGNWNDPATWGGTIPTSADDVTIPAGITVTIPSGLTVVRNGGTVLVNNGNISNNGWITNSGLVSSNTGSTFTNSGFISNYNTVYNDGTFTNSTTFVNNAGAVLDNEDIFSNYNGSWQVEALLNNNGTINNASTFENHHSTFNNYGNGIITNTGTLYNYMATLNNKGTLNNTLGGVFYNFKFSDASSTVSNDGTINNTGTIDNYSLFNNHAGAVLNNNAIIYNRHFAGINNEGSLNNNVGAILENYSSIYSPSIPIQNYGVINNYCNGDIWGTVNGNAVNELCITDTPTSTFTPSPISTLTISPTDTPSPTTSECSITVSAPSLVVPTHRAHTTDHTPNFIWSGIIGAESYRLMVYTEDRSFEYKKRTFNTTYTLTNAEALSVGKYLWRVRTQDQGCSTWSTWSTRNTLFID